MSSILVLCLGNPDCGDDGLGALVAARLEGRLPPETDLQIRTGDMLGSIEDWAGYDALICVDAAAPEDRPGTIHRFDPSVDELPRGVGVTSSHAFGLPDAIDLARALWLAPRRILVYAVEGACFDVGAGLTPQVAAAGCDVAERVLAEVDRIRAAAAEAPIHA